MLTITCKACGHVLYEGQELKPLDEILKQNGYSCPKCGRTLRAVPADVKVSPSRRS